MSTVLYTDDEPGLLYLGKIFLERSGTLTVETAVSAQEALEILENKPVDCIVSDYQMPLMDGIAFLKVLRSKGNLIPFILFTGRGREEVVIEAINNGAAFYLQKGGDPMAQFAELEHKIRLAVEHDRTVKALEESEEKYRSLIDLAPLAVVVHQEGRIVYANPESVRLAGAQSAGDLIGRDMLPLIHPDDREVTLGHFRQLREGATIPLTEMRLFGIDGHPFMVEAAGKPVVYGGVPSVMVVYRDITDRKKQEDELRAAYEQITASEEEMRSQFEELARGERLLRQSEELLRTFMDSATDSFTIWDANLNLVDLNRVALSYLPPGTKKEDVVGRNFKEFLSGSDAWGKYERYLDVIKTGIPFIGTDKTTDPRFGRHWMNVKCFRVGDGLGMVTTDVTREKETEDELRGAYEQLTASEEELRSQFEELTLAQAKLRNSR